MCRHLGGMGCEATLKEDVAKVPWQCVRYIWTCTEWKVQFSQILWLQSSKVYEMLLATLQLSKCELKIDAFKYLIVGVSSPTIYTLHHFTIPLLQL